MSDNKVTLDQLDNSAIEAMTGSIGDVNMLNTENKTIVGALAEIVGKKVIADAIGEPLAETDKFTEMGVSINGLLSEFKTNMMNAGVVVESEDKFQSLIEKIKGLAEGVTENDALRDSLASILQEKVGINVTEEDDMASLITKVDNILAATPKLVNGSTNDISLGSGFINLFCYGGDGRKEQTVNITIPSKGGSNKYINGCKLVSCRLSMTGNGPTEYDTLNLTVTHKRGTNEIGNWSRSFYAQTILTSGGWHLDLTDVQPGDVISVYGSHTMYSNYDSVYEVNINLACQIEFE